jgi:hypothetical protein
MTRQLLPLAFVTLGLIGCAGCFAKGQPVLVFDRQALTWDERCTAEALQGLVNRSGPRLFLHDGGPWDKRWLEVYAERCGFEYETAPDFASLLRRFAPEVKGAVVYDTDLDAGRYVALTMAGVEGLLPVSPGMLAGDTPALRAGSDWPGIDFTKGGDGALIEWRRANLQALSAGPEGMKMQEDEKAPGWGFASYGPIMVDIDKYPILEVEVGELHGDGAKWLVKLTWDRNGDGVVSGPDDDLVLTVKDTPGIQRWNIAQLGNIAGKRTFASLQLHVAGGAAGATWKRARFVSPEGAVATPLRQMKLEDLGIKVKEDLRGRFTSNVAAYQWALDNLMPKCSKWLAHTVNGGTVDGILTGVCGPMSGFDWQVQNRGFVFNLGCTPQKLVSYGTQAGGNPKHAAMYRKILAALKSPAMINGYGDPEDVWCSLLSEYGHYSFHAFNNWSFHSKVPATGKPIRQKIAFTPQNTKPDTGKYYVCFMTSEGDTMKGPLPFFFGSWFDPNRGKTPVNWGINPLMARHFPAMLEYFYDTASPNDYFFAGCSGAGYCYPDVMKDLEGFCRHTRDLCAQADLPCIDIWGATSWDTLRRYEAITKPLALTSNTAPARLGFIGSGTPVVFHELAYWQTYGLDSGQSWSNVFTDDAKRAEAVKRLVGRIEAIAQRTSPPFVILVYGDLHSYDRHASLYREVAEALDPNRFKPVRLDEAMSAIRVWSKDRVMVGSRSINEPLHWAALTGVPTVVPVRLTSGYSHEVEVTVRASIGGKSSTATTKLQPWATEELQNLSVCPTDEGVQQAKLQVQGPGATQEYGADVIAVPSAGVKAKSARLEALWNAGQLQHESGQLAPDDQAAAGQAWSSPPGGKPSCIVYGPYATVAKGRYAVAYRLKLAESAASADASTPVARIDVYAGGYKGSAKTHAERELKRGDFATPGQWEWFMLEADWAGAPDCMETRVYWHAKADLMVDRIAVFEEK